MSVSLVRVADRLQALLFQPGQDEAIDVVARPGGIAAPAAPSARATAARPSAPCAASRISALGLPSETGTSTLGQAAPSLIHLRQVGDLPRRTAASSAASSGCRRVWRTAWISRLFSGWPGTTAGPLLAALDQAVAVIDAQAALGVGVGGMAVVAVVDQHRPDLLLEELHGRVVARGRLVRRRRGRHGKKCERERNQESGAERS